MLRVTEIIKRHLDNGSYKYVRADVMEFAALRGTYADQAIEMWEKGELDESKLDPEIVPRLDAYKRFVDDTGWQAEEFQVELIHANYVGHLDQLGRFDGGPLTVLELKCAVPLPTHCVQCVAYWNLVVALRNEPGAHCHVLYLKGNGRYKLDPLEALGPMERNRHLVAFLGALQAEIWRERYIK